MLTIDDDVTLVAPGAAWLRASETAVVADLHAGTVPTLQKRGIALPDGDDSALHARIASVLAATGARRIVVAGDLVHGRGAVIRAGGASALDALVLACAGREVVVVEGNHDRAVTDRLRAAGMCCVETLAIGAHRVAHGDGAPEDLAALRAEASAAGGRLIVGHHHPALTLRDGAGTHRRVAAFAFAEGLVCLPALSPLARGADLLHAAYSADIEALAAGASLSVAVVVGAEVIRVGRLDRVRAVGSRRS